MRPSLWPHGGDFCSSVPTLIFSGDFVDDVRSLMADASEEKPRIILDWQKENVSYPEFL